MPGLLFSHPSSYAIRALVYLAMQPPGKFTGTKEISGLVDQRRVEGPVPRRPEDPGQKQLSEEAR